MKLLIMESWLLLFSFERALNRQVFHEIHSRVREQPQRNLEGQSVPRTILCRAVDLACLLYFKEVLCLQRSAATAILLRRHGYAAEMVIGVQLCPPKHHAWVEISGEAVNDLPYMTEMYQVLERC